MSPIRRRMWPGTNVADGTRLVRVRFDGTIKSLPYSTKFETAAGPQFFRVIHNYQTRVCRLCREEDHLLKECPKFRCFRCNEQGHYIKDCRQKVSKCNVCHNKMGECICLTSEDESVNDNDNVNNSVITQGKGSAGNKLPEHTEDVLLDIDTVVSGLRVEVERRTNICETVLTVKRTQAEGEPVNGIIISPEGMAEGRNATAVNLVRSKESGNDGMLVSLPCSALDVGSLDLHFKVPETEVSTCVLPPLKQDSVKRPDEEEGTVMEFCRGDDIPQTKMAWSLPRKPEKNKLESLEWPNCMALKTKTDTHPCCN